MANVFFHLINKLFPTEHKFQEIFNWNTSRLTYSCLPILQSLINNYNQNILWEQLQIIPRTCNCVKEENCSVNNICLKESSLYYATVTWDEKKLYPLPLTLEILYKRLGMDWSIKPFLATENILLSDVFSGYREGPVGWNGLNVRIIYFATYFNPFAFMRPFSTPWKHQKP